MKNNILLLPGDGVGPEVMSEAVKLIDCFNSHKLTNINYEYSDIGSIALDNYNAPLPEITLTKIIALLNSLRAGKSLKDEKAKVDLKAYFTRLNGSERVALYAFLTGLDKIMGSEEGGEGDKAPVPKQDPYKIKMKKDTVKADKKPPAGEGSPIVVGESANKSKEKSILWRNK